MKQLFPRSIRICAVLFLALSVSCGEDPELVKKRQEQKLEIARLEGELQILNEQLKGIPADRSAELTEMKKKLDDQTLQLEQLEQEIIKLEKDKRDAEQRFEDFKKKYPIAS
jgi:chromosome segregation ATPase